MEEEEGDARRLEPLRCHTVCLGDLRAGTAVLCNLSGRECDTHRMGLS